MNMKRLTALLLALLMAATLCACGASSDDLGKYTCTSVVMNGMDLGPGQEWIELKEGGSAVLFVQNEMHSAAYTVDGSVITLTNMDGNVMGTGTLSDGKLSLDLSGMTFLFQLDGSR